MISLFAAANTVPLNSDVEIVANVIENGTTADARDYSWDWHAGHGRPPAPPEHDDCRGRNAGTKRHARVLHDDDWPDRTERGTNEQRSGPRPVLFAARQSGTATITAFSGGASGQAGKSESGSGRRRARDRQRESADAAARRRDVDDQRPRRRRVGDRACRDSGHVHDGSRHAESSDRDHRFDLVWRRPPECAAHGESYGECGWEDGRRHRQPEPTDRHHHQRLRRLRSLPDCRRRSRLVSAPRPTFGMSPSISATAAAIARRDQRQHDHPAHVYRGRHVTVRATATDASGFTEQVATSVTILPAQPPAVTITGPQTARVNETRALYRHRDRCDIDDSSLRVGLRRGREPAYRDTTGNRATTTYTTQDTKVVNVHVVQAIGPEW